MIINGQSVAGAGKSGKAYYDVHYQDYWRQNSPAKIEFYMRLLSKWVPFGKRLFELGVGLGAFLERAAHDYDCMGCDINDYAVEQVVKRTPGVPVSRGSWECIPANPRQDVVVAWDVLEHLSDIDAALDFIRDRIGAGGLLMAVVPVYDGPLGWLVTLLDQDETHVSRWSRLQWIRKLSDHGFEVLEWGGIIRKLFAARVYLHWIRPQCLLRRVGSAVFFVVRPRGRNQTADERNV